MNTYRLKKGYGSHVCKDGHVIDKRNPIYTCEENLAKMVPDKFELVSDDLSSEDNPYGILVTADFPLAETIPSCLVWKKGRRYRIVYENKLIDTGRLVNEDEVNDELRKLVKKVDQGEIEDEDEDGDEEDKEADEETEDEEETEAPKVEKKKKRRR